MMKPGANLVAVLGINGADAPNPAGLIGSLVVKYRDGRTLEVPTDGTWQAALTVKGKWTSDAAASQRWTPALELGPLGMPPWGNISQIQTSSQLFPEVADICRLLDKLGVPPDFSYRARSSTHSLRYIHRTIGKSDVYFVANKTAQAEDAVCCFRVHDRRPELWWPETGRIESAAVYDQADGCVRLPLHLDPSGSVFVLFRGGAAIEPDRITSVSRDGQAVLETAKAEKLPPGQRDESHHPGPPRRWRHGSRSPAVGAAMSSKRPPARAGSSMWPCCPSRRRSPDPGKCGLQRVEAPGPHRARQADFLERA